MKPNLRNHFLYKDRYRTLVIPTPSTTHKGQLVLLNLLVGGLIIIFFATGLSISSSTQTNFLIAAPGQWWEQWLQNWWGTNLGRALAEKSPWIAARASGVLVYLLAFGSVTLGLLTTLKWFRRGLNPARIMYLHRIFSLLLLIFGVVHIAGLLLDTYLKMSLFEAFVPFAASYKPVWTSLGILAVYASLIVITSAYLARRLGYKVWRGLHYLSFGIFPMGFLHGVMAGTDTTSGWMQSIYMLTGFIVVTLCGIRLFNGLAKPKSLS